MKPEAFEGRDYHNERDSKIGWKNGAGERTRTPNPQIRSLMLYPVELRTHLYYISRTMLFLKILEKLGRKKVVMDRGPSHPEYHLAKPWTARYYLLFRKRPKWFPFNILIHHILDNDHGIGLHNHPFPYITIILSGGYWETNIKKERKWRGKFYIGFRSADNLHRVDLEPDIKPVTIYIAGPYGLRKKGRSEYGTLN